MSLWHPLSECCNFRYSLPAVSHPFPRCGLRYHCFSIPQKERIETIMKKLLPILMAFAMTAVSLTGCASGSKTAETSAAGSAPSVQAESLESADASASAEETASEDVSSENASDGAENNSEGAVRIGSLKGPTSMGLVSLMNSDTSANQYDFRICLLYTSSRSA